jgi:hypothetical protein
MRAESTDTNNKTRTPAFARTAPLVLKPLPEIPLPLLFESLLLLLDELEESPEEPAAVPVDVEPPAVVVPVPLGNEMVSVPTTPPLEPPETLAPLTGNPTASQPETIPIVHLSHNHHRQRKFDRSEVETHHRLPPVPRST